MPIYDDGMTQEQAERMTTPAPKGKYRVVITKMLQASDGSFVHTSEKSGNKMYKIGSKIVNGPYDKDGDLPSEEENVHAEKLIKTYNAVWGTGLLAGFKRAFPECLTENGSINTDLAIGLEADADLKIEEFEGQKQNGIARLYPKLA